MQITQCTTLYHTFIIKRLFSHVNSVVFTISEKRHIYLRFYVFLSNCSKLTLLKINHFFRVIFCIHLYQRHLNFWIKLTFKIIHVVFESLQNQPMSRIVC